MANRLKVAKVLSIKQLHDQGWSLFSQTFNAIAVGVISGTSFAAPQVAATVAMISSLMPSLKLSTFLDTPSTVNAESHEQRKDAGDVCLVAQPGIVEHILCAAQNFATSDAPQHLLTSDYGVLNVQKALERAMDSFPDGDLNFDNNLDSAGNPDPQTSSLDIDFFYARIEWMQSAGAYSAFFDLDGDGAIQTNVVIDNNDGTYSVTVSSDAVEMVETVLMIQFGDSNFDTIFNSNDIVLVFIAAEYEDAIANNSGWATGDWNGDGEFDSLDLAFVDAIGSYSS
ncbi:hypothetical protein ACFL2H_11145 [Planctomycetota bacterium]